MKLFCHSSRYSESSVSEQQISDQQFRNWEFIYTSRGSGGFIFRPLAAAPLHQTTSKGPCPSVPAWHRNPSHSLLRCHMTWLTALCKNWGSPGLLTTLLASLCTFSNSVICFRCRDKSCSLWECIKVLYKVTPHSVLHTLLDGAPHFADNFGCFCCCSQCRTGISKWSMMPVPSALSWM